MKISQAIVLAGAMAAFHTTAIAELTGSALTVTASSDLGRGSWDLPLEDLNYDGDTHTWWWSSSETYSMKTPEGQWLADLSGLGMTYVGDPIISLQFTVLAGNTDTVFSLSSAILNFPVDLYTVQGSAGVTATDLNGNGVLVTGTNGSTYRAFANNAEIAGLIPSVAAGGFQTDTENDNFGPTNIAGMSSMQASFGFTLSASDSASGTSVYVATLVPAPGAAITSFAGLMLLRRRR